MEALPPGSHLAIVHSTSAVTGEGMEEAVRRWNEAGSAVYRVDDGRIQEYWIQLDAKVCFNPRIFSWMEFQLNHATQSSILGSIIKPLGLTLDTQGLHIRVEEVESTN